MSIHVLNATAEQEKFVAAFLEEQHIDFFKEEDSEELPQHVLESIARGQADIAAGRFITYDEFKKKYPSGK